MADISFINKDIPFNLPHKKNTRDWIQKVIQMESEKRYVKISFIFCSDEFLNQLNKNYLNHDTFTDILTFDYTEEMNQLVSEIYISIERIRENSHKFRTSFSGELHRVMIHGILHLLGFEDKTEDQRQNMREKENECLTLYEA